MNKIIDLFHEIHPPDTPLPDIYGFDINFSCTLLDELDEFYDYYFDEEGDLNELMVENIDKDFPGWTQLRNTVLKFHSKLNLIEYSCSEKLINDIFDFD